MKKLGRVGLVGRFKPLHNGAKVMLESLCEQAKEVLIGIGSSNKYNARNPFTADESEDMVNAVLKKNYSNYSIMHIPDFGHEKEYSDGKKWAGYVAEHFGALDYFISGNEFVSELMKDKYAIMHPADLIIPEKKIFLRATEARVEIARDGNWKDLVPKEVADYLKQNGLIERFKREFGLQTLENLLSDDYNEPESLEQEKLHNTEK